MPRALFPALPRALLWPLAIAVLAAALWFTVWPPRTAGGYAHQALQTTASFRSQVATARLWGEQLDRDHAFLTTVRSGLAEMESDATGTLDQFAAYQPPSGQAALRSRVTSLGSSVVARLGELRVAARAGKVEAVVRLATRLDDLLHRIDRVTREVRS